eukprot:TRINITY_DN93637_c0_g1_i1.p1 TRINITY_DN93637_c0_g1~~TRINITY_DN93637_c0_g1_i1.p1  ORF type:complete len:631 (-),score=126.73 TRINITY_DN93637_c0_g1_i1:72-1964(-)
MGLSISTSEHAAAVSSDAFVSLSSPSSLSPGVRAPRSHVQTAPQAALQAAKRARAASGADADHWISGSSCRTAALLLGLGVASTSVATANRRRFNKRRRAAVSQRWSAVSSYSKGSSLTGLRLPVAAALDAGRETTTKCWRQRHVTLCRAAAEDKDEEARGPRPELFGGARSGIGGEQEANNPASQALHMILGFGAAVFVAGSLHVGAAEPLHNVDMDLIINGNIVLAQVPVEEAQATESASSTEASSTEATSTEGKTVEAAVKTVTATVTKKIEVAERMAQTAVTESKDVVKQGMDGLADVKVDPDSEDEYWTFGPFQILRKKVTDTEVILTGLLAGGLVEFSRVVLLHPFDTLKTRLQAAPAEKPFFGLFGDAPERKLHVDRLFDGLGPAVATVPGCAIFWAVKDVVRRNIIAFVPPLIPFNLWHDVIATTIAAGVGEGAYWIARTPGEVLKTRKQVDVLVEDGETQVEAPVLQPLWEQSVKSFPLLAITDVPIVAMRTAIFIVLHSIPGSPQGVAPETFEFMVAQTLACMLTLPLDVARTRMLLSGDGLEKLPDVLQEIQLNEGLEGLTAGWQMQFIWNGLTVGSVLGLVRQAYPELRTSLLLQGTNSFDEIARQLTALAGKLQLLH